MARTKKGKSTKSKKTGDKKSLGDMFSIGAIQKTGEYNVTQASSFFYSPELTSESWLLPKSRQEIIKWCRIFYNLEPYVYSITNLHAKYPFSKFEINTPDESITEFYKAMAFNEEFDLFEFIIQMSLSYQKFGEAIPFGNMEKGEDNLWRWTKFILMEPELVEIKKDMFSGMTSFEMVPTQELQTLVRSQRPEDQDQLEALRENAPEVIQAVEENRNIRLSEDNCSLIANITDASATRGTSPIQCLFKVLIYQDWIRLAQAAYAQRYVFPVELWTIGSLEKDMMPSDNDLTQFRNMINQAVMNPPFTMVFPPIVKYEALSTMGKNFPVNNEYEYIHDQLMVGMGVNKNLIMGEGPSFSNVKTMALHRLVMEYKVVRDRFENWIINKFFRPIAIKNNFYVTERGKKKLLLPTLSWHKSLDIEEEADERDKFIELHEKGLLSTKTLFTKFPNLDYDEERKNLEREIGTVFDHGDDRLPKKVGRPSKSDLGGGGGGGGGAGATSVNPEEAGSEPVEPIEPGMPEVPGAESPEAGEEAGGAAPEAPSGSESAPPATE